MKKCDVIIPIYNAYEDVIECIESVLKNTNFDGNKLILIDDKSPDERIQPMLKKYAKEYKNEIIFLTNEKNKGFVGTVNRGMKESKNDVVLLNSDTEVTPKWLEKLSNCAYSSDDIATVTPLSNNATLASVPIPFFPNDLPKGYSLEEMSNLVEKGSLKCYPEIPTAHGFCMFIKRNVLELVGYFDEENYGRGYGEENDFSFRCYEFGFRNVLCDDTYILHKESKSFLDSKDELIKEGLHTLEKKFPYYKQKLDTWVENKPLNYVAYNVALELATKDERKNLMFVVHDWKNIKNNIGGTSLHMWDLIKNIRSNYNVHVFAPENGIYRVYSYFKEEEIVVDYPNNIHSMPKLNYKNSEYRKLITNILEDYSISFVHVHHMIGHYFDLFDVLNHKKIKYMVTLHDFYCQCPLINKLYCNTSYCGTKPTTSKCNECLSKVYNTNVDISSWRKMWLSVLEKATNVVVPSEATKEEINLIFPKLKIEVLEHGVDIEKAYSELKLDSKKNDIAFIGAIGYHKGSKILEEFIKKEQIKKVKVHLFGKIDSNINKSNSHYIYHGLYKRDELKSLLNKNNIKLICLFSLWPETYSYTMTEAIACGIPVISFDYGAISERIKKYNLGWTIKKDSSIHDISNYIKNILSDETEYQEKINSINNYKIMNTKEMSIPYEKIYNKYLKDSKINNDKIKYNLVNNRSFRSFSSNPDYSWVFNTLKWKIISKVKIPKKIKKVIKKIIKR